jgi:transcriptional regulator with XRE-family HTH domain
VRGDLTQRQFAGKIGVGLSTYVEYEKETRSPNLETLIRIHEATGVDMHWLAAGVSTPSNLDVQVLEGVIEAIELEVPDIDAKSKAKLVVLLYNDRIAALQREHGDGTPVERGKIAS